MVSGDGCQMALLRRTWKKHRRYDVVFYAPWVGLTVSTRPSLPAGGAETQVLMLAQALVRQGLRAAIIAYGSPQELPAEVEGVAIHPRPTYKRRRRLLGRFVELFHLWRSLWQTPSRAIVYRCAGFELGLIGVYARIARRRLVFATGSIIDFDYSIRLINDRARLRNRLNFLLYNLGVRLAIEIVVQTEDQVELCQAKLGRRPALVKSIEPLEKARDLEPEAFLWVGRLVPYKRPLAYVALARALPEATFWMVGVPMPPDEDHSVEERVISEAREIRNLQLLPPRSRRELGDLMMHAVAIVNTTEFEGMPNVLLEAWSRGIPALILTHDPGGVVRKHGLGGFANGSHERFVQLARDQWLSRQDRQGLSERCRSYIATHHSPERIAEAWLRVIAPHQDSESTRRIIERESRCVA
jgi:glycosyltransferase involved in cell wall biosynthesis